MQGEYIHLKHEYQCLLLKNNDNNNLLNNSTIPLVYLKLVHKHKFNLNLLIRYFYRLGLLRHLKKFYNSFKLITWIRWTIFSSRITIRIIKIPSSIFSTRIIPENIIWNYFSFIFQKISIKPKGVQDLIRLLTIWWHPYLIFNCIFLRLNNCLVKMKGMVKRIQNLL